MLLIIFPLLQMQFVGNCFEFSRSVSGKYIFGLQREKMYILTCLPSIDTGQPATFSSIK